MNPAAKASQKTTVWLENGLRRKSNPKFILGYTDTETVKLDLDNMSFQRVRYWALGTAKQFRLGGFIILKSSKNSYHVVFDRPVSWVKNVAIVAWVCLMTKHRKLTEWLIMQCIKRASTLRLSPKKEKKSPRIIFRHGKQSQQIRDFLHYRRLVQTMMRRL
jgi:hypothetical protein